MRRQIIKLAQSITPRPAAPSEANELVAKAAALLRNGQSEEEFADAADAFKKVLILAPWIPDFYLDCGRALEKANRPAEAAAQLRLYLLAAPKTSDAKSLRQRIAELEAAGEKLKAEQDWLEDVNGARFAVIQKDKTGGSRTRTIDVLGDRIIHGGSSVRGPGAPREHPFHRSRSAWKEDARATLNGRSFVIHWEPGTVNASCWPNCPDGCTQEKNGSDGTAANCPETGTISDDGRSIKLEKPSVPGTTTVLIYERQ